MINENRLIENFRKIVSINGESGNEIEVANFIKHQLDDININYEIDDAEKTFGGNCGNLIAHLPGIDSSGPPILFSSHMDSIEPTKGISTLIDEGILKTDGKTILAADDRAGVSIILEVLQSIQENRIKHPPIIIAFTVAEEIGMYGSKYIDVEKLGPVCGFVFDSSADPGSIIQTAPSKIQLSIQIHGKAAHAAVSPEKGVNAITIASNAISKISTGKFDNGSTLNFGTIRGGKAINIVPEEVKIEAELRGFDNDFLADKIVEVKNVFDKEAKILGGKVAFITNEKYRAFNLKSDSLPVQIAVDAIKNANLNSELLKYSGGSDANVFNAKGLPTVNLGLGFKNCHSVNEYIKITDLIKSAEIAFNIVEKTNQRFTKQK